VTKAQVVDRVRSRVPREEGGRKQDGFRRNMRGRNGRGPGREKAKKNATFIVTDWNKQYITKYLGEEIREKENDVREGEQLQYCTFSTEVVGERIRTERRFGVK